MIGLMALWKYLVFNMESANTGAFKLVQVGVTESLWEC